MKLWDEFKKFAFKGNVVDMAVGVVVGGAFSKIVTSLVNDIIMPPIGLLIGGVDFSELKWVLKEAVEETGTAAVSINYGTFIQLIIDFMLIALSVFTVVKLISKGRDAVTRKEREAAEAKAKAEAEAKAKEEAEKAKEPTEKELLAEIRDLLAKK